MNGSEGGWVLFPSRAGGEVHKRRFPSRQLGEEKGDVIYLEKFFSSPRGVYSTHSPVSRTAQVSVQLCMRTSFPSAHSPFTRFSKRRRKGGQ
ncbi:hypothetical protein V6N11_008626 [Hibiscus sabdariffa]|uniref:Uncharacterized protein n=1 Tax=Hibiscus sabdariffa TaxID=183260 RepID=A0ABR2PNU6_9ROSI